MDVRSLAWRTDLALLEHSGSIVEDRGDHLVVRTPLNPVYYWGNFLLLSTAPTSEAVSHWLRRFESEFPDARHRTFGVDGTDGRLADLDPFTAAGFEPECSTVMTAGAVHPPARPNADAVIRQLTSDDDWAQQVELSLAGEDADVTPDFVVPKVAAERALVDRGHGRWYGAFLEGRLASSLGLFAASEGLARFQQVKTHPDARGRGLAGSLVHTASRWGLGELGARTLVMVADPDYLAIRIYRAVGFTDTETQLQAMRTPQA
jgi:GNAT superfamily N-acetyltransferase